MASFPRNLRPPPSGLIHGQISEKPVYTLHLQKNHDVFAMQLIQPDDTLRTGVGIFKRKRDAMFYARLLENHKNLKKEWPALVGKDPRINFETTEFASLEKSDRPLDELYISEWDNDEIQDFCLNLCADLLIYQKLVISPNSTLEVYITLIEHNIEPGEYKQKLIEEHSDYGFDYDY